MYTPPLFQARPRREPCVRGSARFGTVCACDGGKPVASALPFCLDYAERRHAARGVPCRARQCAGRARDGKSSWLLAVNGADAYVSPHWYVSPDQVPTWLYQAVHLTGPVRHDRRRTGRHLDALSAKFESWLAPKPPWTSAKMTAGRLEAMKQAIVGLVMTVEEIEGSFKLNQHKSDVDHVAIAIALLRSRTKPSQAIGKQMVALRPQLDYKSSTPASVARIEGTRHDHLRHQAAERPARPQASPQSPASSSMAPPAPPGSAFASASTGRATSRVKSIAEDKRKDAARQAGADGGGRSRHPLPAG